MPSRRRQIAPRSVGFSGVGRTPYVELRKTALNRTVAKPTTADRSEKRWLFGR
ncbi:MAG: hypothetical protein J6K14_03270 [Clostridia bacterium]|nr:hypothetical protein [Clostridia bacterium]